MLCEGDKVEQSERTHGEAEGRWRKHSSLKLAANQHVDNNESQWIDTSLAS